jgi:hypothetical protein
MRQVSIISAKFEMRGQVTANQCKKYFWCKYLVI